MPPPQNLAQPQISSQQIQQYRSNGYLRVQGIISKEEAAHYRSVALEVSGSLQNREIVFKQIINSWTMNEQMKRLTLNKTIASVAEKLAGVPLRLWHDHILIKPPHNNVSTEFHQDQPYWPHQNSTHPISAWIALGDIPPERGCMAFIPGSHLKVDLERQNLRDAKSLFNLSPGLAWDPREILPLRAGDCTFHHGRCAHMAFPNQTDEPRVAHAIIYMDDTTTYDSSKKHVVTDPLGLKEGDLLEGPLFPRACDME